MAFLTDKRSRALASGKASPATAMCSVGLAALTIHVSPAELIVRVRTGSLGARREDGRSHVAVDDRRSGSPAKYGPVTFIMQVTQKPHPRNVTVLALIVRWSRPAAVRPHPLLWMLPDRFFQGRLQRSRRSKNIDIHVLRLRRLDFVACQLETNSGLPNSGNENQRCVEFPRNQRWKRCRGRQMTEKRHLQSRRCVLVY